ncbi:hypothetical protein ACWD48_14980 [Streptomyces sp. NPDC002519]
MTHRSARAAVLSAGSWGTAVARILADAGTDVVMHARRAEIADGINTAHRGATWSPRAPPRSPATAPSVPPSVGV